MKHPDVPLALVEAMHTFFSGYKSWLRSRLPAGETNPTRMLALVFLQRMGPISMGTLAGRLALPKSNVTVLVDELEREGLVERTAHPEDRRSTVLALTAAGRRFARNIGAGYDREVARLFEALPTKDAAAFLKTIERLTELLHTSS